MIMNFSLFLKPITAVITNTSICQSQIYTKVFLDSIEMATYTNSMNQSQIGNIIQEFKQKIR